MYYHQSHLYIKMSHLNKRRNERINETHVSYIYYKTLFNYFQVS
jgi:hypothetical protein